MNTYIRVLSSKGINMPHLNVCVELDKDVNKQMTIINHTFPPSKDVLKNRKKYEIVRAFIPEHLKNQHGIKWCDIYRNEARKPVNEYTNMNQKLFPKGRYVTEWKFDGILSGVISDVLIVYSLCNVVLDDSERFKVFGGLPANANANFKYSTIKYWDFKTEHDLLCHYSNVLNHSVWYKQTNTHKYT